MSLEGNSTKKRGGAGADGKRHSQYFRFIFTTQCVDKTTVQGRRSSRGGAGRGVVGKHVALHARYNFRFRCPLLRPLCPPRPLSVVIHFCIHFAHLMPCLLACYPSLSLPLSLSVPPHLPPSFSPFLSLSLTNCDACVSLLAKKLKALRPVSVCLCPSATLSLFLSLPRSLSVCALWSHLIGASIFLGSHCQSATSPTAPPSPPSPSTCLPLRRSCALFALPVRVHLGAAYCGVAVATFAHILQNHYLNTHRAKGRAREEVGEREREKEGGQLPWSSVQ